MIANIRILSAILLLASLAFVGTPVYGQDHRLRGVMVHTDLEGGCWYLQAEDGKKYEIIGDSDAINPLHVDGQYFEVLVTTAKGALSRCMVGKVVRLVSILDSVRHPVDMMSMNVQIIGNVHRMKSGKWYVLTVRGKKFELQNPLKKYRRIGVHYNEFSKFVQSPEKMGPFDGVIVGIAPPQPGQREIKHTPK